MAIALRYAARSDVGHGPQGRNEDSGYAGPHLLVLADGMGGHAARRRRQLDRRRRAGRTSTARPSAATRPLPLLAAACTRPTPSCAEAMAGQRRACDGMGTTVDRHAAHRQQARPGPHRRLPRPSSLRDGTLTQITKDHSFVQSLVDEGRITAEEAEHHPQRSLVTRVLTGHAGRRARPVDARGPARRPLPHLLRRAVRLRRAPTPSRRSSPRRRHPGATAERLIEIALKAGTRDNVTVIVGDVVDLDRRRPVHARPQVVGAAGRPPRRPRPAAIPTSPAAKAAALSREAAGRDRRPTTRSSSPRTRPVVARGCLAAPSAS